ncbi:putative mycolyltransferase [Gordonia effusa NBRC 100432]|uniref:Putative mycolyltransferase n=2 Tax=Gordonia effusa TaxID=263908 RepID=H0R0F7_9ACTN|nr:putative mycolyltransferase [Gordonia effusa NBRC 100432]
MIQVMKEAAVTARRMGRRTLTTLGSVLVAAAIASSVIAPSAAEPETGEPTTSPSTSASPSNTPASSDQKVKASKIQSVVATTKQQVTALVYSGAMDKVIPVTVLRPKDTSKPAPTLYLLNGAGGGEDTATWAAKTDYVKFFADKHVNVVTPVGGAFSYYTDWRKDDPVLGRNKWQTFLTKELPPLIDAQFNTTKVNSIAGISMAGTSVMNLAVAAPKLYRSVAAFSGCARTSDPLGQAYIRMVVADRGRGDINNMWGPPGSQDWVANDPYLNASRLRGMKVYMTAGSGLPGVNDRLDAPLIDGNPMTLANQILLGGGIEAAVNLCTRELTQKFRSVGVPVQTTFRPNGNHSWGYWETDLHNTWPKLEADLR